MQTASKEGANLKALSLMLAALACLRPALFL